MEIFGPPDAGDTCDPGFLDAGGLVAGVAGKYSNFGAGAKIIKAKRTKDARDNPANISNKSKLRDALASEEQVDQIRSGKGTYYSWRRF